MGYSPLGLKSQTQLSTNMHAFMHSLIQMYLPGPVTLMQMILTYSSLRFLPGLESPPFLSVYPNSSHVCIWLVGWLVFLNPAQVLLPSWRKPYSLTSLCVYKAPTHNLHLTNHTRISYVLISPTDGKFPSARIISQTNPCLP